MGGGAAAAVAAGVGLSGGIGIAEAAGEGAYADPAEPALPQTDVEVNLANTALVITDPQIDFFEPRWGDLGRCGRQC